METNTHAPALTLDAVAALFDAMPGPVAYGGIRRANHAPVEVVVLYTNPAYAAQMGQEESAECMAACARVAQTGQTETVERYIAALQRWCVATVYCPQPNHFVAILSASTERPRPSEQSAEKWQAVITARKQIELELQQSHDLLRKLSEQVPGVFYQFKMTPDGAFSAPFASAGLIDMLGLTPDDVKENGARVFEVIPAQDRAGFIASTLESARSLRNWVEEFRVALPGQPMRWREGHARPERQADGSIIWHGFIADATERVETRKQLQLLNETLESRVIRRTQELEIALASAEQAKRSRGEFLAKMSHEIRTPMNAILGMTYLALQADPVPPVRAQLEKISHSGKLLLGIINNILDFTKIDAGKLELAQDDFDLLQLLQNVVQLTQDKAQERGLHLTLEIDDDVAHRLCGDSLRLGQILINYVNNAIKFTQQGGVFLRIHRFEDRSINADERSCLLCFEVADTGMGLNTEQISRLFQSFEQGDNSTTRKFGGTGLGLAISKQLAQMMGGEVGVSSREGMGSTFWFTARLRLASPAVDAPTPPQEQRPPDTAVLRGAHILVVDDNDFNLDVAEGLLTHIGVQVMLARDGAQALQLMHLHRFDAVLMDIQMPVMDGLEATRRIRAQAPLAHTCVIAMTANALREDHERCLQAGMNDVVTKPIDPEHLFQTLVKWWRCAANPQETHPPAVAAAAAAELIDVMTLLIWDPAALIRTLGKNPATHRRLLDKFQRGAGAQVDTITQACAQDNCHGAADIAHKLKSSARAVGALRLGALCETIEQAGRSGDVVACRAWGGELVQTLAQTVEAIETGLAAPHEAGDSHEK